MKEPLVLIALSILGMLIYSLIKMGNLKKDYASANKSFHWIDDYLYKDSVSILISFLSSIAWYFLFGEAAAKFPAIQGFVRTSFFVMGGMGSLASQLLFGVSKKYIRGVIDIKTNIADGVAADPGVAGTIQTKD